MLMAAILFYVIGSLVLIVWSGVSIARQISAAVGDKKISESKEDTLKIINRNLPWLVGGFLVWLALLLTLIKLQIFLSPFDDMSQ
jgi:hypothetical protein